MATVFCTKCRGEWQPGDLNGGLCPECDVVDE